MLSFATQVSQTPRQEIVGVRPGDARTGLDVRTGTQPFRAVRGESVGLANRIEPSPIEMARGKAF